ncbi:acyl carrier protein, partial [Actinomadura sp. 6K520]|uniref:acyl carrier protein n=1 Tax=Actinomadura sp. 6K520 TaxID=2530364 RepID=UPI0010D9D41F
GFPYRVAVTGTAADEIAERLAVAAGGPSAAEPVHPVRSLTLRGDLESAAVAEGTAALAGAFPPLFPAESAEDPAGERLARAIGRFGLPLRLRPARGASGEGTGASLEWAGDGRPRTCPLIGNDPADAERLLLEALAMLYADGADLKAEPLRTPGGRFLPDLPTHPFRRTRFWIDEPPMGAAAGGRVNGTAAHGGAEGAVEAPPPDDRDAVRDFLLTRLKDVLQSPDDLDPEVSLQEAGADSFITTLFITKVEEHYDLGLPPEDLHVESPLAELIATLADTIAETAVNRTERSA